MTHRDSTVITIGELGYSIVDDIQKQPAVKIVEHYRWTGTRHTELYSSLVDIIKKTWKCKRIVADATGVGQPVDFLMSLALVMEAANNYEPREAQGS